MQLYNALIPKQDKFLSNNHEKPCLFRDRQYGSSFLEKIPKLAARLMATDLLEALLKLRDWGWNLGKSAGWRLTHQREMRGRGGRGRRGGWLPDQEGQNIFCKQLSCILFNIQVGPLGARVGRPAVLQARPILRQPGWCLQLVMS